ncbi:Kinase, NEK [Giardia muris]|uniref:non-specific serine/threonine protein kinase n=1 Tax=Giardia muris TaxID=5742 RepID=A0A4Z1T703_GIAMU|nr:Kinase, NEK [Giardia muris]|eukprot:TNJ28319.1 Kinase, NEK [Giardia muris]
MRGTYTSVFTDDFEISEGLGKGGFGHVYKVIRKMDGALFACKEMDYAHFSSVKLRLIETEASIMKLLDHPHIARLEAIYDDTEKKVMQLVMELFTNGDLNGLIKRMRISDLCLSEAQVWCIARALLSALDYMHSGPKFPVGDVCIIHRDIKPENIMLSEAYMVKLIDFGICKILDEKVAHTRCGSSNYAAPEIFVKNPAYRENIDIWALGCVLYELVRAETLFNFDVSKGNPEPITTVPRITFPGYSRELEELVQSMLILDPDRRPSAQHLMESISYRHIPQVPAIPKKYNLSLCTQPLYKHALQRLDGKLNRKDETEQQTLARKGQTSSLKALLSVSVYCVNNQGKTALHLAVEAGKKFSAKALLPYEARFRDNDGFTALGLAVNAGNNDLIDVLLPMEAPPRELCTATYPIDDLGMTPLMWEAVKNDSGAAHCMLAQRGRQTPDGRTALMFAAEYGSTEVAKLLLDEAGMQTSNGEFALLYALENGHLDIVELLLEKEQHLTTIDNRTAQTAAAYLNNGNILSRFPRGDEQSSALWSVLGDPSRDGPAPALQSTLACLAELLQ